MEKQERKLKVFLCHASQDKAIVHELYQQLLGVEWIEPWLDAKKLLPGQDWQAEIKNAVETADSVIIFLSNTSISKDGFVQKELRLAKDLALQKTEGSIFLIPIRISDCDVPSNLRNYHWANYFGKEKNQCYTNLLASLKLRLDDVIHKELLLRQNEEVVLHEAKLILVGEGEVGRTSLLDALRNEPWQEHDTAHNVEVRSFNVIHPDTQQEFVLNAWDFGGRLLYRPTHQLFFSASAIYLVVWKPRQGAQMWIVKEWIKLIKRREPDAKILVVATHGGPKENQSDIDHQELINLFGSNTLLGFHTVDNKPDVDDIRKGIKELKDAIARIVAEIPEIDFPIPKTFGDLLADLQEHDVPYLTLDEIFAISRGHNMTDDKTRFFLSNSNRLGHLTYYQNDPVLREIVILKPDWLVSAISFVLDDEVTYTSRGLIRFSRLSQLWNDPTRPLESRYPQDLHPKFLRIMERFDLSYRVVVRLSNGDADPLCVIPQLVPDFRPNNFDDIWTPKPSDKEIEQTQICRIVTKQNESSEFVGDLIYQLIVRLYNYSLGKDNFNDSAHWRRGLILENESYGRALIEYKDNDIIIIVRAPYPELFLSTLTGEVKYLIESFWENLRCKLMIPCPNPSGCKGLFELEEILKLKRKGKPEYPCAECNEWSNIEKLLRNVPSEQPAVQQNFSAISVISFEVELQKLRYLLSNEPQKAMSFFNYYDDTSLHTLERANKRYKDFLRIFANEIHTGPRLLSISPIDGLNFNSNDWDQSRFRLTLWCEQMRLPLWVLNEKAERAASYEIELDHDWFNNVAPYLKEVAKMLDDIFPISLAAAKIPILAQDYEFIVSELEFMQTLSVPLPKKSKEKTPPLESVDFSKIETMLGSLFSNAIITYDEEREGLQKIRALIKNADPDFGGIIRISDNGQNVAWVHKNYLSNI